MDSGVKKRVVASEFGFNTEDSTEALQKAIDSGAVKVIVDKQDGPWIVAETIRLRGDQEVVFEDGVSQAGDSFVICSGFFSGGPLFCEPVGLFVDDFLQVETVVGVIGIGQIYVSEDAY